MTDMRRFVRQHGYTCSGHTDHLATLVQPPAAATEGWLQFKNVEKNKNKSSKRRELSAARREAAAENSTVVDDSGR